MGKSESDVESNVPCVRIKHTNLSLDVCDNVPIDFCSLSFGLLQGIHSQTNRASKFTLQLRFLSRPSSTVYEREWFPLRNVTFTLRITLSTEIQMQNLNIRRWRMYH